MGAGPVPPERSGTGYGAQSSAEPGSVPALLIEFRRNRLRALDPRMSPAAPRITGQNVIWSFTCRSRQRPGKRSHRAGFHQVAEENREKVAGPPGRGRSASGRCQVLSRGGLLDHGLAFFPEDYLMRCRGAALPYRFRGALSGISTAVTTAIPVTSNLANGSSTKAR
jgi:hypothetical protein